MKSGTQYTVESARTPKSFAACVDTNLDRQLGRSVYAKTIDDGSGILEMRMGGKENGNGTYGVVKIEPKAAGGSKSLFYLGGLFSVVRGTDNTLEMLTSGCK